MTTTVVETIDGTVTRVAGNGFQIAERDGWINVSKYAAAGAANMPHVGDHVAIGMDKSGYARTISMANGLGEPMPPEEPAAMFQAEQEPPRGPLPSKEVTITRMACLNTATAILSSGGQHCEAKEVVALAAKLEQWVNR